MLCYLKLIRNTDRSLLLDAAGFWELCLEADFYKAKVWMEATASFLFGHGKASEEQAGTGLSRQAKQGRAKHQRRTSQSTMRLFSSFLLNSFWGFMAIISVGLIIPQGDDGGGKPHYFEYKYKRDWHAKHTN